MSYDNQAKSIAYAGKRHQEPLLSSKSFLPDAVMPAPRSSKAARASARCKRALRRLGGQTGENDFFSAHGRKERLVRGAGNFLEDSYFFYRVHEGYLQLSQWVSFMRAIENLFLPCVLAVSAQEDKIMVEIIRLERDTAVAPQLVEADFATIAQLGFRSVVNNRPDGEAPDQLPNAKAEAAARRHGLEFRYLPVHNMNVTDDDVVAAFAQLMDDLPRPVLYYCRTGTRCTILWAQVEAGRRHVDEVLAIARNAGFDLDFLGDRLMERGDCRVTAAARAPLDGALAAVE